MKKISTARRRSVLPAGDIPLAECEKIELVRVGRERRLLLCGVRRIVAYDAACMTFRLKGECVSVEGGDLRCTTYSGRTVGVQGDVRAIRFTPQKEEGI